MKQLIQTHGKASGSKTLLTVNVLAIIVTALLEAARILPEGSVAAGASAPLTHLVDLAWGLGAVYTGRRLTDAWADRQAPRNEVP